MEVFIAWLEREPKVPMLIRAAIAHLWFVTIHPFDDGNGRIARALADYALVNGEREVSVISVSRQIQRERTAYYATVANTSDDTAGRDLSDLAAKGILHRIGFGKTTSYAPFPELR